MGKTIEKLAITRNHDILLRISSSNVLELNEQNLSKLDVAIEFTNPDAAPNNLAILARNKVPTICGSTAWLDKFDEVSSQFKSNATPFLYASNFSIGVNIFFKVNKYLAELMNKYPTYDIGMTEVHHIEKKDAPSGTAVTLAEQIIEKVERKKEWVKKASVDPSQIDIISIREKDVKGTHTINYSSQIDNISITHEAHKRDGFAMGALLAAEWIQGKQGIFDFDDVLK